MHLLLLNLAIAAAPALPALANAPVPALDLPRYAGQWHEIARLPMYFQRNCAGEVTARYTLQADGTVEVRNACRRKDGRRDESIGVARRVQGSRGALEVRFAPGWLGWLPFVWADYWVVELDPEYRWAVVGSPSRKYLWVLSREPTMDEALFEQLREHAGRRGYPVERLLLSARLR